MPSPYLCSACVKKACALPAGAAVNEPSRRRGCGEGAVPIVMQQGVRSLFQMNRGTGQRWHISAERSIPRWRVFSHPGSFDRLLHLQVTDG